MLLYLFVTQLLLFPGPPSLYIMSATLPTTHPKGQELWKVLLSNSHMWQFYYLQSQTCAWGFHTQAQVFDGRFLAELPAS